MNDKMTDVSVVYTDNFLETYQVNCKEFKDVLEEVKDDNLPGFHIGEKYFIKKEVGVVATKSCSIQFH